MTSFGGETNRLEELLGMLNNKIAEINYLISQSMDPDSDGLCDRGEYFIGVGFAAIQQYLLEVLIFSSLKKWDAFKLGPTHPSGIPCIELINASANWWKHEAEWPIFELPPKNAEKTIVMITDITDSPSYQLSNVLASFCENELSCIPILSVLKEWRKDVYSQNKR